MAEIRVQPRKKSHGWVWLLLLLVVIAAVVYYLYATGSLTFASASTHATTLLASAAPLFATIRTRGLHGTL